jgi:hypothetical protein
MKAVLLKPLDGNAIGETIELDQTDFNRLVELGAVKAAPTPLNKAQKPVSNKAKE